MCLNTARQPPFCIPTSSDAVMLSSLRAALELQASRTAELQASAGRALLKAGIPAGSVKKAVVRVFTRIAGAPPRKRLRPFARALASTRYRLFLILSNC